MSLCQFQMHHIFLLFLIDHSSFHPITSFIEELLTQTLFWDDTFLFSCNPVFISCSNLSLLIAFFFCV